MAKCPCQSAAQIQEMKLRLYLFYRRFLSGIKSGIKTKKHVFALSFHSGHAGAVTASAVRVLLIQHHMILSPFFVVVAHR